MSLLSSLVLLGTLLVLHAASEDVEKKAVVNDEFEVDYETAASLAGLAIECHDQVLFIMMLLTPPLSGPLVARISPPNHATPSDVGVAAQVRHDVRERGGRADAAGEAPHLLRLLRLALGRPRPLAHGLGR